MRCSHHQRQELRGSPIGNKSKDRKEGEPEATNKKGLELNIDKKKEPNKFPRKDGWAQRKMGEKAMGRGLANVKKWVCGGG